MCDNAHIYTPMTKELAAQRKNLAPKPAEAFKAFSQSVFADGAILAKSKQLIAVAVAHVTQCPYCIRGHTAAALQHGATAEEIMADEPKVWEWLTTAAGVPGFIGFAVGRTTFWEPMADWRRKAITREATVAEVARRYRAWVGLFEEARRG